MKCLTFKIEKTISIETVLWPWKNKNMILSQLTHFTLSFAGSWGPWSQGDKERRVSVWLLVVQDYRTPFYVKTPYRRHWPFWKDKIKMVPYGKPHLLSNAICFLKHQPLFGNSHMQIAIAVRPNVLEWREKGPWKVLDFSITLKTNTLFVGSGNF